MLIVVRQYGNGNVRHKIGAHLHFAFSMITRFLNLPGHELTGETFSLFKQRVSGLVKGEGFIMVAGVGQI